MWKSQSDWLNRRRGIRHEAVSELAIFAISPTPYGSVSEHDTRVAFTDRELHYIRHSRHWDRVWVAPRPAAKLALTVLAPTPQCAAAYQGTRTPGIGGDRSH